MPVNNKYNIFTTFLIFLIGFVSFSLMLLSFPVATDISVVDTNTNIPEMPFKKPGTDNSTQTYSFNLQTNKYLPLFMQQQNISFIPDDCIDSISINDTLVDLTKYKRERLCDPYMGTSINLGGLLENGKNKVIFKVSNKGGEMGLNTRSSLQDPIFLVYLTGINISLFVLLSRLFEYLKLDKKVVFIAFAGILLREFYMIYTGHTSREHDSMTSTGHVDYIKYVMKNWSLPSPESGWEYFQSGGYYIWSALIAKFYSLFGLVWYYPLWQSLSLLYYIGVIVFGLLIFKETIKNRSVLLITSALFIFWGGTIIHSTRITNDVMYYMLYSGSIYFLLKWYLTSTTKFLYWAGAFVGLAFVVKSNALLLLPICALTVLGKFVIFYLERKKFFGKVNIIYLAQQFLKRNFAVLVCCITFVGIGAGIGMSARIMLHLRQTDKYSWLIPNLAPDWGGLTIDNSAKSLTYFDIKAFLIEPFANPHDKNTSRDYFWNYIQKSSLFGEFGFRSNDDKNKIHTNLASIQALLYIIILAVFLVGIFSIRLKDIRLYWVLLLDLVISLAGLISYRTSSPCGCNQDFRFILPFIISFLVFYSIGLAKVLTWKNLLIKIIAVSSAVLFTIIFLIFFLIPSF